MQYITENTVQLRKSFTPPFLNTLYNVRHPDQSADSRRYRQGFARRSGL